MNKIVKYLLRSAIPFNSLARAGRDIAGSVQRVGASFRVARDAIDRQRQRADQARKAEQEEMRLRNTQRLTSEQIFKRWYAEYGWTEMGLEEHRLMYRHAKFAWLSGTVMCMVTMVVSLKMHPLVALLLISAAGVGIFACTGRAFFDSLQQARIELRSMITIREYVGRADFFKRFLA